MSLFTAAFCRYIILLLMLRIRWDNRNIIHSVHFPSSGVEPQSGSEPIDYLNRGCSPELRNRRSQKDG